jgi:hypothetical protein
MILSELEMALLHERGVAEWVVINFKYHPKKYHGNEANHPQLV